MAQKKKLSLTVKITISLVLGVIAGLLLQSRSDIAVNYIKPFGTIYLNLIKMVVVPVVLLSIMQGIISLQDVRKVGSIGVKTVAFYMCTTALAVTLGLLFANILNVGGGYVIATEGLVYEAKEAPSFIETIVNIFPSNFFQPMA
ncbi:MAG: cation:dicarboxylase symporter family transporter, partial [Oscillibacter sp.]|nr:cation:dicarboxylase symporter family transporter [Oscillibacter sp.]